MKTRTVGIVHAPRREAFASFAEYARARQRWIEGLNHFQRIEAVQFEMPLRVPIARPRQTEFPWRVLRSLSDFPTRARFD